MSAIIGSSWGRQPVSKPPAFERCRCNSGLHVLVPCWRIDALRPERSAPSAPTKDGGGSVFSLPPLGRLCSSQLALKGNLSQVRPSLVGSVA